MPRLKAFKLDVKYESQSSQISLAPDLAIYQLKQEILSQFKIPVEEQALICNGKHLGPETDNLTIKQARIPNNSKISVIWSVLSCVASLSVFLFVDGLLSPPLFWGEHMHFVVI